MTYYKSSFFAMKRGFSDSSQIRITVKTKYNLCAS